MLALKYHSHLIECGTDEAGRGCLAGPVTAAAVILPDGFEHPFMNDSKQLSKKKRMELREIVLDQAVAHAFCHVFMDEIDQLNILWASITAMHRAIAKLETKPNHIAVDGNRFLPYGEIPHTCIIKGDGKYLNIAAASILAKTERDLYMEKIHLEHPEYGWNQNMGYPTKKHREAIRKFGPTAYHRKSFKLLPDQLEFEFTKTAVKKR